MENMHKIWNLKHQQSLKVRFSENSVKRFCKIFSGSTEVRWDKHSNKPADDYTFFYGNGDAYHHLGMGFFIHKMITSLLH
jgi:hypothetical protein